MLATWLVGFVHPLGYILSEQRISAFLSDSLVEDLVFSLGFEPAYFKTRVFKLLVSVGTPDGKRPLERSKHRWMNSTK
jgi:hypothetical protein